MLFDTCRNQDGTNLTVIEGERGITIVDPLSSTEVARAALDLYNKHRGEKPLIAVILTHTHVDHYAGIRGIVDQADVDAGKTKIYAPEDFVEHAVSEGAMGLEQFFDFLSVRLNGPKAAGKKIVLNDAKAA